MSKKLRDRKISFRLASPLYDELEAAAAAEDRSLSELLRRMSIDLAERRISERGALAA
jgi:Ribbon-helix-helix protein, copG family